MPLFKGKKKDEFKKAKIAEIDEVQDFVEEPEEYYGESSIPKPPVQKEEESEEETISELQKKINEKKKAIAERKAQQAKVYLRQRAVPIEDMFNSISDRLEALEITINRLLKEFEE